MALKHEYIKLRKRELAGLLKQRQYENDNFNGSVTQKNKVEELSKKIKEIEEELQTRGK
jgi:hypothetical protein